MYVCMDRITQYSEYNRLSNKLVAIILYKVGLLMLNSFAIAFLSASIESAFTLILAICSKINFEGAPSF